MPTMNPQEPDFTAPPEDSYPRDVPYPASATDVFSWKSRGKEWVRDFEGTKRTIGPEHKVGRITVHIIGTQFMDGHCERRITVTGGPLGGSSRTLLSPARARKLATAMGEAADEIAELEG
jgi:hypothetical protein